MTTAAALMPTAPLAPLSVDDPPGLCSECGGKYFHKPGCSAEPKDGRVHRVTEGRPEKNAAGNPGRSTAANHYSRAVKLSATELVEQLAAPMRRWPLSVLLSAAATVVGIDADRSSRLAPEKIAERDALSKVLGEYAKSAALVPSVEQIEKICVEAWQARADYFGARVTACGACLGDGTQESPFDPNCVATFAHRFVRPFAAPTPAPVPDLDLGRHV